jgi:hypothetical protein
MRTSEEKRFRLNQRGVFIFLAELEVEFFRATATANLSKSRKKSQAFSALFWFS